MKYIRSLDGLRALAVILVILYHFYFGKFWGFGWMGVQLFFVLSGFLITTILLHSKSKSLGQYLTHFYVRRSLRIFPLYFGVLAAVLLIFFIANFPENLGHVFPWLVSYTYNYLPLFEGYEVDFVFTHFWSLSVEEQFYLVWPFIIFFLNDGQLRKMIVLLVLACPLLRWGIYEWLSVSGNYEMAELGQIVYRFTPAQIDAFAVGAAIPIFGLEQKINAGKAVMFSGSLFLVAGLLNTLTLPETHLNLISLGYDNGAIGNYQPVWAYTVINLLSASLLLYLLVTKTSWFSRILEWGPVVKIGKISYGMYIFHWPLKSAHMRLLDPYLPLPLISFVVYFTIVFIVSYASFQLYESYFLDLKNVIQKPADATPPNK